MEADRIIVFAETMTPALAGLAAAMIVQARKVPRDRRQLVLSTSFDTFKTREHKAAHRFMVQLFSPVTPWSAETADMAVKLLHAAFSAALEQDIVWDRRLSARTVAIHIKAGMLEHIRAYARERGMEPDPADPMDVGFVGITLEGTRR